MKIAKNIINCKKHDKYSQRIQPFSLVKYMFNYKSSLDDKNILDAIILRGQELANKVNAGAASNSTHSRSMKTVSNNAIAGLLAEFVWKDFLNKKNVIVEETTFENASNQIDLSIQKNQKSIEVRSSFPRNGIKFAICHNKYQFDIIGPYSNNYKPAEIQKDYYTRTLFPFQSYLIMEKLKNDNFEIYLTGGASWEMIADDKLAITKSFIPEDEISVDRLSTKTNYRVIPYSKALDTYEILGKIRNDIK